jgi:Leucine-rich repeat (LRR) protein
MAGISLILQNNPNVTQINCGTSSPKLGGTVDISAFPNLQVFICNSNNITALSGYAQNSNLTTVEFFENKVTGSIPSLSAMTNLQNFSFYTNLLTGPIPSFSGLTNLQSFSCPYNRLTGPIPSLNGLNNLQTFNCGNQRGSTKLTGSIPSLSGLNNLQRFWCHRNQLTGPIPSLSGLNNLQSFFCYDQQGLTKLIGSIPSLSGLNNLQVFDCHANQLTSFAGGSVSNTLGNFQAQDNQLNQSSVNAILSAFVAANRTAGTRTLNLGGTGNFGPTGQGLTDFAILTGRGWIVTTGTRV